MLADTTVHSVEGREKWAIGMKTAPPERRGGRGEGEEGREEERCFSHSPALCQSNFSLHFSFLIILIMTLMLGIVDVPPGKKKILLSFNCCSYCRLRGDISLSGGVWGSLA